MANTVLIGHCECPLKGCSENAEVREGKRRVIVHCPVHKTVSLQAGEGQKLIRSRLTVISETPAPVVGVSELIEHAKIKQEPVRKKWSIYK